MALGGGTFLTQNKGLPGAYINFVSAARASAALSERGIATMPLSLDWCIDGEVITVTSEQFQKTSLQVFGYPYTHEKLRGLRDLFHNIRTGHFFRLNSGGAKATNTYATARYTGARGNDIKIVIEAAEGSTAQAPLFDVTTVLDTTVVDVQKGVAHAKELHANDFVTFAEAAELALAATTPLVGGTDGAVENAAYQTYLDKIEPYSFHTMGCTATDSTVKNLFASFTRRMRNECGAKFQCVLFRNESVDFEGVISVENGMVGDKNSPDLVHWVTGAQAGCAVNKSLTNAAYTGEYAPNTDYTQAQLEAGIRAGKLMLHQVGDTVRVLEDINTFTSVTDEKSADFSSNQTMRVLDQIGNDIAALFGSKYLGNVPNDAAGRISLWSDIVKHHQEMQKIRAIEDFSGKDVTVEAGDTKKAVVVTDAVQPVNAMAKLYMTVIVQ